MNIFDKNKHKLSHVGDPRPIGIFDSGVGGLSVAKCIAEQLPNENLIYIADSLYAPYGDKSIDFIQQRVNQITDQLIKQSIKALVIACNTATVNAIDQLRVNVNLPIIGVEPAIKPAIKTTKSNHIGILVTQATSENLRFKALVDLHRDGRNVHIQPCLGLVELIEQGKLDSVECHQLLVSYLQPLLNNNVDTLVLGCTHYPFLQQLIESIVGDSMVIIETALPVTEQLAKRLAETHLIAPKNQQANYQFFSSKYSIQQAELFNHLWQKPLNLKKIWFE